MKEQVDIRPPAVAGMFYPSDPDELRRMIAALIERVETKSVEGRIRGVVAPHAGYLYSGLTAAHGYAQLRGEMFETVVVVSPSHQEFFHGVSVFPGDAYATPLGVVKVNALLRDELLAACDLVVASESGHGTEHALEVQLPFMQEILPPFMLLPIVVGDQRREVCMKLGEALAAVVQGKNVLLVASTDLSHFHSAHIAGTLDDVALRDVEKFDYEKLMTDLEMRRTEACGGGPTVAVMAALAHLGVQHLNVLHHSNSGDVTGDYSNVVGYLSAVAY